MIRTLVASVIALLFGAALGWYFGYTRPIARNSWRVAQITGWGPTKMADAFNYPDKTFRDLVGSREEGVARASLLALTWLEHGDTDRAKDFLAHRIRDYYVAAHSLDPKSEAREKFLRRIEEVSDISPSLKRALTEKPKRE
jgi:hypothetical protein